VAFDDLGGESLPSYPSSIIRVDLQAEALFTPGTPPPGVLTNASSLTYAVDYAADIVCVQWRVDASLETDFTPCAAGGSMDEQQLPATPAGGTAAYTGTTFTLNGPEEGAHQVDVRVLDALGNSGVFHRAFTIDRTPPALAIVSGPAAGSTINQSFVTFGFTIEKGARYICGVDEPLINQSCSGGASHQASGLNDGSHSFSVRATDPAGNAAELSRGFNVSVGGGGGVNPETGAPMIGIADSRARGGRRLSATGRVVLRTRSAPGGRRISAFSVSRVRRATRIRVRCSGRGCPYRSRSYRLKQRGRIGAPLRGRTLGPRAVLEVTLVGKGKAASRSVRFRFRAPTRAPRRVVRCISRYGKVGPC